MEIVQHEDRFVIGNDDSIETQLTPQQIGQDAPRGSDHIPIQLRIGIHDGGKLCIPDCSLERGKVYIMELSHSYMGRRAIQPAL